MNEENEFDRFIKKHMNILAPILSDVNQSTESQSDKISNKWHQKALENLDGLQRVLYFAKKNNKCLIEAERVYNEAMQKQIEYKNKIIGEQKPFIGRTKIVEKKQLMDYDKAKALFWNMYLKDSVYPNQFIIDDSNRFHIQELIKYFIQDSTCKINLNKGIALCGGVGTSKTTLMTQLSLFSQDNKLETAFKIKSMRDYIREVGINGLGATAEYLQHNFCFDDIAVSAPTMKHYGTEINPLDDLIQSRYERFTKRNSKPTHFTMNIDFNPTSHEAIDKLTKLYDIRSIDRIRQMCNFVYLGGQSRRK